MKRFRFVLIAATSLVMLRASADSALAQSTVGERLFETKCTSCHQGAARDQRVPDASVLRRMAPESVYAAFSRTPHTQIPGLSEDDKKIVATYLGGRKLGVTEIGDAKAMPNGCAIKRPITNIAAGPMWNGWGVDPTTNARFQSSSEAGLSLAQVPNLKLKWAFGLPLAEEAYSQPTVAGGRVFVGSSAGTIYSLDAATGCVYWSFQADGAVRVAISIGQVEGMASTKYAVYFGDQRANTYALDADNGKVLWKKKVDEHPVALITGSPTLYEGRLYVPMASKEEHAAGFSMTYECCTFRGSVTALDAKTGEQIWKTYIIPDPPKPTTRSPQGVQHYAPAGGAVWAAPTVDVRRHALYIGTGNAYTEPASKTTDAVMALDMDTGKVLWSVQDTEDDAWLAGCGGGASNPDGISENCPKPLGPDFDFGSSMILQTLPDGHRVLVAGQKSGMVWAHDPDQEGKVLWRTQLVDKLVLGMITFGGAADDQKAYFGLRSGGVAAVSLKTGAKEWFTSLPGQHPGGSPQGQTAALTVIPGIVFSGGWDGILRAFSAEDGHEIWEADTVHDYETVNSVKANGGSMAAPGPTVAGGRLFVGSGYVVGVSSTAGNVLLMFSAQ
jgi:polyvinyl alcohol dehydrogenase (cytochrome)